MSADVFTSQVLKRALELKEQGMTWSRISARLGVSDEGLKRRLVPGFATRRQALIRQARYDRALGKSSDGARHIPEAEVLAVLRTVPSDTRRPIARLMGDPLPGRSALDRLRDGEREERAQPYSPVKATRTNYLRGFLGTENLERSR